jgi:hypothetical protein
MSTDVTGKYGCWIYSVPNYTWSPIEQPLYNHYDAFGIGHNNKLFLYDVNGMSEAFDPVKNAWEPWTAAEIPSRRGPSLVSWKDSILMFERNVVQMYNSSTNQWKILNDSLPNTITASSVVLPNDYILVADNFIIFLYDIIGNSFKVLDTMPNSLGQSLINLNDRIFLFGGKPGKTEEFHYQNNSWTSITSNLIVERQYFSSIAVPADLFSGYEGIA